MEVPINWRRVWGNFALLIPTYQEASFPYLPEHLVRVPHRMVDLAQIPDLTANDVFLFTHLMRGKVQSHMVTTRAIQLRRNRPQLFHLERAARLSASTIDKYLQDVFGKVPPSQRYGEAWRRNCEILLQGWDGDILNVFDGVETEEDVRARILNKGKYHLPYRDRGFYEFQEKMCALLAINLMHAGFIPRISMSFPVDFHHLRALIGTGMIQLENGTYDPEPLKKLGDQIGRKYLDRFPGMDPVVFSEFLFVLSREACVNAVTDPDVDWEDLKIQRQYRVSCSRCPLRHRCKQTVVAGEYYRKDSGRRVIKVVDRPEPPKRLRLY